MKKQKLSLIVPCYNEEKNIPLLLERFAATASRDDIELIIVDNGSTDGSAGALDALAPKYTFAKVVSLKKNAGYGGGILAGLAAGCGEYLGWTHADMQTDPGDAARALALIESRGGGAKIYAKGARRGRPLSDTIFTAGMSLFETVYLGAAMSDINAQPNVFHRSFFESWKNPPTDFSLDLFAYHAARRQGLEIARFPVVFARRAHGASKWNTGLASKWKFIKRTIEFSAKLKKELK